MPDREPELHSQIDVTTQAQILMQKYSLLKQEVWQQTGYYKAHVRNFQVIGGIALTAIGFVAFHPEVEPKPENWWLWWVAVTMIPVITNYLVLDIVQAQYATILLADRLVTIEETINKIAKPNFLIWESRVCLQFWNRFQPMKRIKGIKGTNLIINPSGFLSVLSFLMVAAAVTIPHLYLDPKLLLFASTPCQRYAVGFSIFWAIVVTLPALYLGVMVPLLMREKPTEFIRKILDGSLDKHV